MIFSQTEIPGLILIEPKVHGDTRGYFMESFKKKEFEACAGIVDFIQDNESKSAYGVMRGLHFQLEPHGQAKLVRCISGSILDVVVDLRSDSATFGKTFEVELSSDNKLQLFIPRGFAHGFVVLSKDAVFSYKVDNFYQPEFEAGIRYDDLELNINWRLPKHDLILSEKDKNLPCFADFKGLGSAKSGQNV